MIPKVRKSTRTREIIPLERFFRYVNFFYLSIGMVAYDSKLNSDRCSWQRILLRCFFIFQMVNLNAALISELIYVFLALSRSNNFLEATMNLSFIGFVIVGDVKIRLIQQQRKRITRIVHQLDALHPLSIEQQADYKTAKYLSDYSRISKFYFIVHLILIWSYNLYWAIYYLICDFWLGIRRFERMLPYYCWVPWDWKRNWIYQFMYVSQNLGGQACLSGQLAADLFMCALATLLIMHFTHLATQIEHHVAGILSAEEDMDFLSTSIIYHQQLLLLGKEINKIFGVSLLCNFASSSFIICFVIFHITIGSTIDNVVMLMLFLFCAMVQLFMIGSYAQQLINASEQVGEAVYNHDWFGGELRYRKMMILILRRAQHPSYLRATSFLSVSMVTVTDLLQLSYKFFALLRTMYSE
ncbi:putative odorant receptor 85d [Drosophila grimshawi]|uniref:Odorant receptor n=1 Tax=Drosophila grimshawi TaxID=7222 RepID=B4JUZ7_DROGR|nr:putative odorant receptor 85d [Drosophila grimshawi]EDV91317.1 GH17373 [Drosophila grimshawi]